MANKKEAKSVGELIKEALDGRTQRWLAYKISMSEDKLSNKIKGLTDFTDSEVATINAILKTKIKCTVS